MNEIFFFCIIFSLSLFAQQTNKKSAYIAPHLGIYNIAQDKFDETYGSNIGFMPGISLGLQISQNAFLFGKASYFSKDGVPVFNNYETQNGKLVLVSQSRYGSAKFREWLLNTGMSFNFNLSKEYKIGFNGGLTFTFLSEEITDSTGALRSTKENKGLLGFFGGATIERIFENTPFSVLGEVQYNFTWAIIQSLFGDYSGLNINVGIRYYFVK